MNLRFEGSILGTSNFARLSHMQLVSGFGWVPTGNSLFNRITRKCELAFRARLLPLPKNGQKLLDPEFPGALFSGLPPHRVP